MNRLPERTLRLFLRIHSGQRIQSALLRQRQGRSGKIARAKPALQSEITGRLLDIEQTHFDQGRQDLIKPYIIESFEEYFDQSQDQAEILAFVREQVNCRSPKARKLAIAFLEKWEGAAETEGA